MPGSVVRKIRCRKCVIEIEQARAEKRLVYVKDARPCRDESCEEEEPRKGRCRVEMESVGIRVPISDDGFYDWRLARRLRRHVVHVVDHGDEQVEEELAAVFHLILHGATALECASSADDEGEIVCS